MKKIMIFLTVLILSLSSCKFAQGLNDSLGFVAPEKNEITIEGFNVFANTDKDDERSFFIPLSYPFYNLEVTWDFLSENEDFVSWYNSLEKSGYAKTGFSITPNALEGSNEVTLYRRKNNLYVIWKPELSYITVHAGSGNSKRVYFDSGLAKLDLTWNMLERNDDFMAWYKSLSDPTNGVYTKGLSRSSSSENVEEPYAEIRQFCSDSRMYINSDQTDFYVVYDRTPMLYPPDMNIGLSTYSKLFLKAGETLQTEYFIGYYYFETNLEGLNQSKDLCSIVESVSFSSSDESVATVDSHGLITGVGTGAASITFTVRTYNGHEFRNFSTIQVESDPIFESIKEFENELNDYSISDDGKIQIGIQSGRFCISENYGKNWMRKTMSVLNYNSIVKAAVSHSGESIVVVVPENIRTYDSYNNIYYESVYVVYLSTDYGRNFSSVVQFANYPERIAVSDDGNTIALVVNIYDSYSSDKNYQQIKIIRNKSKDQVYDGVVIPEYNDSYKTQIRIPVNLEISSSGKNVLLNTNEGVLYSENYGLDFSNISNNVYDRSRMSSDGSVVLYSKLYSDYGYTDNDGLHKFENGVTEVLTVDDYSLCDFWASPDCKSLLYIIYDQMKYSTNRGYTWNTINQSLNYMGANSYVYSTNNVKEIYFAYRNTIYRWRQ